MSNGYFDTGDYTAPSRLTLARANHVGDLAAAVEGGFDKLPVEAALKEDRVAYAADTGAANAYVVALAHTPASYTTGLRIVFKAADTNTGASTINVSSLGVKTIKRYDGSALSAGDILAGMMVTVIYDGTDFRMVAGFAPDAGSTVNIANGSVTAEKLAASAVETAKINDGAVTEDKIAGDAVTAAKIAPAALKAIGALTPVADRIAYFTGAATAALATLTSFGRSLIAAVDAAAARTVMGVVIGADVQAYSAALDAVSGTNTGDEVAATTTVPGIVEKATQAEMVARTAEKYPDAELVTHNPGVPKLVVRLTDLSATPAASFLHNALGSLSVTDGGTGVYTLNWTNTLNTPRVTAQLINATSGTFFVETGVPTGTSVVLRAFTSAGAAVDPTAIEVVVWGNLA